MAPNERMFAFEEVTKHDMQGDCWLVISGKVYDVTAFMDVHPGGAHKLLSASGKDATSDFEDVGHSDAAQEMLEKFCIGEIDRSTLARKRDQDDSYSRNTASGFVLNALQLLVSLLLLALALAAAQHYKKE